MKLKLTYNKINNVAVVSRPNELTVFQHSRRT